MLDLQTFSAGVTTVADGGWSTILWQRGVPRTAPAELACVSHAHMVSELAREYIAAGAQFIRTNSFAANRLMLSRRAPGADPVRLSAAAGKLAVAAARGSTAHVLGVIGPSGTILALREANESQLHDSFAEQAATLAEAGVAGIVLETFSELTEIMIAIKAVRDAAPKLQLIACFSFDSGAQRTQTHMGLEASEAAAALDSADVDAIGCNCGAGAELALPAVVALRAHTKRCLWVAPSVGLPELESGHAVYRTSPEDFAEHVAKLLDAGANIVGGCCGAGPEHIKRLAGALGRRQKRASNSGRNKKSSNS